MLYSAYFCCKKRKKTMKITRLIDIAEKVKISKTAVSKILNNRPMNISASRRQEIIKTAERMCYRPNLLARSLRNKRTKSIGVVVPDMSTLFYPELIRSVATRLFSHGYQTIICDTEDSASRERLHLENLLDRQVDGLVVAPVVGRDNIDFLKRIHESKQSLILIDRYFLGEKFRFITTDNKEGAEKGVKLLARQGVTKIIYLGEKIRHQSLEDRLAGVKEETARQEIRFTDKEMLFCSSSRKEIRTACVPIFKNELNHTGIFLESNRLLTGLLDAAGDKGFSIPGDFRVISFDAFEPKLIYPEDFNSIQVLKAPIPVIKQDIDRMGTLVSEYLISSVNKNSRRRWQIKLPPEIIKTEQK